MRVEKMRELEPERVRKELERRVWSWFIHTMMSFVIGLGLVFLALLMHTHDMIPEIAIYGVSITVGVVSGFLRRRWKDAIKELNERQNKFEKEMLDKSKNLNTDD